MAKAKSTEKSTENSAKNASKSSVSAKKSVKSKDWVGCVQTKSFNYDSANYTRLYLYLYTQVKKDYTFRKKKRAFLQFYAFIFINFHKYSCIKGQYTV